MTKSMTTGNPAKLILLFTLPLLCGNIFQQFYNMMDALIVGRILGVDALAAVGCTGSIMFLIVGFAQGVSSGLAMVTARYFGSDDLEGVRKSFAANIVIGIVITILLTAFSLPLTDKILKIMKTPQNIFKDSYDYLSVIFIGIFAVMMFNVLSNVLRGLGDGRTPLVFLVIASILNIILDLVFILIFEMGVAGAALATVVSQVVSGLLCIFYIVKKFPILHLKKEDFKLTRGEISQHLTIGLPMGFQTSIIGIGVIIIQIVLNKQGEISVAAYTASQKIEQIILAPIGSFGLTMATYVAQNFGAGKIKRIQTGVRCCCAMSLTYTAVVTAIAFFGAPVLADIFIKDSQMAREMAIIYLKITSILYWSLALLFILRYTLQGVGQSVVPTIAGFMELIMRAIGCIVLAKYLGFSGICIAYVLAWPGSLIPLTISYFITMNKALKKYKIECDKQEHYEEIEA